MWHYICMIYVIYTEDIGKKLLESLINGYPMYNSLVSQRVSIQYFSLNYYLLNVYVVYFTTEALARKENNRWQN